MAVPTNVIAVAFKFSYTDDEDLTSSCNLHSFLDDVKVVRKSGLEGRFFVRRFRSKKMIYVFFLIQREDASKLSRRDGFIVGDGPRTTKMEMMFEKVSKPKEGST